MNACNFLGLAKSSSIFLGMPDRTGNFWGWSANLSNFLGLGVEAGTLPMYPQKMRVPPLGFYHDPQGFAIPPRLPWQIFKPTVSTVITA